MNLNSLAPLAEIINAVAVTLTLLFLIVFVETGLVVMPFLPGAPRPLVVGAPCGVGLLNLPLTMWHS